MPSTAQAVLLSWSIPPAASFAIGLTVILYLRGWMLLRRAGVPFVPGWRCSCFLLGMFSLWAALASPLDTFSGFLLTAHMLQHMALMMIAPPLILLGAPLIPLVRGLPIFAAREFAGPFLNSRLAARTGNALIHPAVALTLMGIAMFAWHTPRLYELALASGSWHEVEHACFFVASLIFWWPVIQPWPSHVRRARWIAVPYLLLGDLQNTILSAILVFSDRVLYPSYQSSPRLFGFAALSDQVASGAIMWVIGSTVFLIPATIIAVQCLSSRRSTVAPLPLRSSRRTLGESTTWSLLGRPLRRLSSPTTEALTFVVLFVVAGLILSALASGPSDDDQALRTSQVSGPFLVSVYSLPGNLDTGRSEVSVLVQDRDTMEVLQDAQVELRATRQGASVAMEAVRASSEDSENKLLQTAEVDFANEGAWMVVVHVWRYGQGSELALPIHVVKPGSGFPIAWGYVVFVLFAAILALAYWRRHRTASGAVVLQRVATANTNRSSAG